MKEDKQVKIERKISLLKRSQILNTVKAVLSVTLPAGKLYEPAFFIFIGSPVGMGLVDSLPGSAWLHGSSNMSLPLLGRGMVTRSLECGRECEVVFCGAPPSQLTGIFH